MRSFFEITLFAIRIIYLIQTNVLLFYFLSKMYIWTYIQYWKKGYFSCVRISYIQCSDLLDEICCHNSIFGKNERYFLQIYWRNFCVYLWQVCLSLSRDLCRLSESKRPRLVGRSRIILSLLVERISTCLNKHDHLSATLNL